MNKNGYHETNKGNFKLHFCEDCSKLIKKSRGILLCSILLFLPYILLYRAMLVLPDIANNATKFVKNYALYSPQLDLIKTIIKSILVNLIIEYFQRSAIPYPY